MFWVEAPTDPTEAAAWLESAWAKPVSEQGQQDRLDGFGLSFVGVQ